MLLGQDDLVLEKSDDIVEQEFSIEMNAVAFEVLSGGLYTDRIGAIVREIGANAWDANKSVGNEQKPFDIHLPTDFEPHFSIRDYGPGLSPDGIRQLYTHYFRSTKTTSNDFIGCMGIGAKSPFSLVDSFTVVSYFEGKKYVYTAYKNESRKPAVTLMGSEDTSEPNGLEVIVPVTSQYFREFQTKVRNSFRFYDVKPNIVNWDVEDDGEFDWPENSYMIQGENFGICHSRQGSLVIMGNVAYRFESQDFQGDEHLTKAEQKLVNHGIHLYVPIGSVQPAASRERLTYTETTRKNLKAILLTAVDAIQEQAVKEIKEAPTYWDAINLYMKVKTGVLAQLCDLESSMAWKGKNIFEIIQRSDLGNPVKLETLEFGRSESFTHSSVASVHVRYLQGSKIFVNDLNRGGYAAARRYMEDNDLNTAWMVSDDIDAQAIVDLELESFLVYVSKLPKPPRAKRNCAVRSLFRVWNEDRGSFVDEKEVDLEEGGVYVEVKHNKWRINELDSFGSDGNFRYYYNRMKSLGFNEPVYALRPGDIKRIQGKEGWITLDKAIEDLLVQNKALVRLAAIKANKGYVTVDSNLMSVPIHRDSPLRAVVDYLKEMENIPKYVDDFVSLNQSFRKFDIERDEKKIEELTKIIDSYPLLRHIKMYESGVRPLVAEYIELIDQANESVLLGVA